MKQQDEKITPGEVVIENKFIKWLDNFWYHYKWPTIIVAFFLFVGVVCFAQCSTRATGDLTVTYAGGYTLSGEERARIVEVFDSIAPQKKDGKGQLTTILNDFSVYTEDELKPQYLDADGNLNVYAFNNAKQVSKDHLKSFGTYAMTGESAVWLVSEYVYQTQNLSEIAVPLSELFEVRPENSYDDYAIRLKDTALYQYYDALKVLPEDTLVVMPHSLVWGESANTETYAEFREMYYAIVSFKKP